MQASYLWKKLFTKKHLIEHYEEKVKNKPSVGLDKVSPRKFEQNLDENIEIIIRKSMNDSYHFTRYKQLLFTKGPAKLPRAICVPTLRDKLTASVLNELLVGVYGDKCKTIVAWDLGCLLVALLIILLRCRKIKNRKMLWMPFGAYGLSVVYGIAYYLNLPFWKIFSSDMTAALCLLFALIIESCIQCGLIPSNTGYAQLFAASTISAQITDQSGKCIYQSQDSECIAPEIVRQVVQCPIMLENGIRLSGKPILGGYVLWKENLSELQEIVRELEDRKEELKDANLIEEENLRTKREVEKLFVKNQLYDKIQKQTARQSKLLTEFIEAYSMEEDENKREKILGKIVVIGAYIKRRSNLIFIAEQAVKFPIRELELCFRETIKNLEWNHVEAGFSTALEEIRSEDAMQIYDFFEAVIEESLEDLLAFNVNLKRREARIIMSMSVECKTDLQEIARRYGAYAEQDFDGSWLLSLILGGGGGK